MDGLRKIVVTGPESSGKSQLCSELAHHYQAEWVPEYARIYLEEHGPSYDFDTLGELIHGHLKHQGKGIAKADKLIFLDTDLLNYWIWEELVFGKTHAFLHELIQQENDHLYLITYPDLTWQEDPLRENPSNREELFELHLQHLNNLQRPFRIIRGQGNDRLQNAISAVEELVSP